MRQFSRRTAMLAVPFLLGFLLFYVLPFGQIIFYSLTKSAMDPQFVGLRNFEDALNNRYFRLAAINTLKFTAGSVPLVVICAFLISLMLFYGMRAGSSALHSAFILPMLLPSAAVVSVIRLYFSEEASPVRIWLERLGMEPGGIALTSVYFIFLWKNAGFQIILDLAALRSVPKDIQEAAALDGANCFQRFWTIVLPFVRPTILFGAVYAGAQALRIFRETYLLYGDYPKESVYFLQHYMNNHFYKLNYQKISAAALILMSAILLIAVLIRLLVGRRWKA